MRCELYVALLKALLELPEKICASKVPWPTLLACSASHVSWFGKGSIAAKCDCVSGQCIPKSARMATETSNKDRGSQAPVRDLFCSNRLAP